MKIEEAKKLLKKQLANLHGFAGIRTQDANLVVNMLEGTSEKNMQKVPSTFHEFDVLIEKVPPAFFQG